MVTPCTSVKFRNPQGKDEHQGEEEARGLQRDLGGTHLQLPQLPKMAATSLFLAAYLTPCTSHSNLNPRLGRPAWQVSSFPRREQPGGSLRVCLASTVQPVWMPA